MHSISWSLRRAAEVIDGVASNLLIEPDKESVPGDVVRSCADVNHGEQEWQEVEKELSGDVRKNARKLLEVQKQRQLEDDSGFLHQALTALLPKLERRMKQDDCTLELQLQLGDLELQLQEVLQHLHQVAWRPLKEPTTSSVETPCSVSSLGNSRQPCTALDNRSESQVQAHSCIKNQDPSPNSSRSLLEPVLNSSRDEKLIGEFQHQVESLARHIEKRGKTYESRQAMRRQIQDFDLQLQNLQRKWQLEDKESSSLAQLDVGHEEHLTQGTSASQPSQKVETSFFSLETLSTSSEACDTPSKGLGTYRLVNEQTPQRQPDNDAWLSDECSDIDQVLSKLVSSWKAEDEEIAARPPEDLR